MIFAHLIRLWEVLYCSFDQLLGSWSDYRKWYEIWSSGQSLGSDTIFGQIFGKCYSIGHLIRLLEVVMIFDQTLRSDMIFGHLIRLWGEIWYLVISSDLEKEYDICLFVSLWWVIWYLVIWSDYEKWPGRRTFHLTFVYILSDLKLSFHIFSMSLPINLFLTVAISSLSVSLSFPLRKHHLLLTELC